MSVCSRTDYAMNGGSETFDHPGSGDLIQPPAVKASDGIGGRAWVVTSQEITDGLTKTYLFGEKYVNPDWYTPSSSGGGNEDQGDNECAYIGSDRDVLRMALPITRDRRLVDASYAFGSPHPGGAQMVFCDGAVHTMSYDTALALHKSLLRRDDKLPTNWTR